MTLQDPDVSGLPRLPVPHVGPLAYAGQVWAVARGRGSARFRTVWLLSELPGQSGGLGLSGGLGRAAMGPRRAGSHGSRRGKGCLAGARAQDPLGAAGLRPGASLRWQLRPLSPRSGSLSSAPLDWVTAGRYHTQAGNSRTPRWVSPVGQPSPAQLQQPSYSRGGLAGWSLLSVKCKAAPLSCSQPRRQHGAPWGMQEVSGQGLAIPVTGAGRRLHWGCVWRLQTGLKCQGELDTHQHSCPSSWSRALGDHCMSAAGLPLPWPGPAQTSVGCCRPPVPLAPVAGKPPAAWPVSAVVSPPRAL